MCIHYIWWWGDEPWKQLWEEVGCGRGSETSETPLQRGSLSPCHHFLGCVLEGWAGVAASLCDADTGASHAAWARGVITQPHARTRSLLNVQPPDCISSS